MPTPRAAVYRQGSATLLRLGQPSCAGTAGRVSGPPILIVPSLLHRWYIVDLRRGASVVEALCDAGYAVYCLDWGQPGDEDRFMTWEATIAKLGRAIRRITRIEGVAPGVIGYSMGATIAAIHTALHPSSVRALVSLAGPIDCCASGILGDFTNPRWFDVEAIAAAGNISYPQLVAGFAARRPTRDLARWFHYATRAGDADVDEAFWCLQAWACDEVAVPAAVYARFVSELYQRNALVRGEHRVGGRLVSLAAIECPVMVAVATDDTVCPPASATALCDAVSSRDTDVLRLSDGHVGAVVGPSAPRVLYPALRRWFGATLGLGEQPQPHAVG